MADNKNKTTSAEEKESSKTTAGRATIPKRENRRSWRGALLLTALLLLLVGVIVGGWFLKLRMFERNPHFILHSVDITSSGWWSKTAESRNALLQRLGITLHKDNLFALKPAELRQKLVQIPSIERAEVCRILPDHLEIVLNERLPRALLGDAKSTLVVDNNAVVMSSDECLALSPRMPILYGFETEGLRPGHKLLQYQDALNLLNEAMLEFPEFQIRAIQMPDADTIQFMMIYRKGKYNVTLPSKEPHRNLVTLLSTLVQIEKNGKLGIVSNINLLYENGTVYY